MSRTETARYLRTQDRFLCMGLVYRIVEVSRDKVFALREDDTGSVTLWIDDDASVELLGPLGEND